MEMHTLWLPLNIEATANLPIDHVGPPLPPTGLVLLSAMSPKGRRSSTLPFTILLRAILGVAYPRITFVAALEATSAHQWVGVRGN